MGRRVAKLPRGIEELSAALGLSPAQFREDFSRLEGAPLKDFIGEFLIRNPYFHRDCRQFLENMPPDSNIKAFELSVAALLAQKYGVFVPNWRLVAAGEALKLDVKLLPSVRGFKVIDTARADELQRSIAEKHIHLSRGDSDTAAFYNVRDTAMHAPGSDDTATLSDKLPAMDYLMGGNKPKGGRYPFDNYLLLSVDLNRPREEVNRFIKKYLDIHLPIIDSRRRMEEWIRYLMVFDLKAIWGMTWEEIGNFLAEAFPELKRREKRGRKTHMGRGRPRPLKTKPQKTDENLFEEERNLRRYFTEGKKLVLGNYRDYIRYSQTK